MRTIFSLLLFISLVFVIFPFLCLTISSFYYFQFPFFLTIPSTYSTVSIHFNYLALLSTLSIHSFLLFISTIHIFLCFISQFQFTFLHWIPNYFCPSESFFYYTFLFNFSLSQYFFQFFSLSKRILKKLPPCKYKDLNREKDNLCNSIQCLFSMSHFIIGTFLSLCHLFLFQIIYFTYIWFLARTFD